jgi:hypothetical protein
VKAKKLLAALGVLMMAVPGVAFASHETQFSEEIVEGHTVFAAVSDDYTIQFAAVAGLATKRTIIGGVLWFNDQELISGGTSAAGDLAAGQYIIATQAGDDPPSMHMNASYLESYEFKDPNDQVWIVDRYTYDVCTAQAGGDFHIVPCEANAVNEPPEPAASASDLDGDGHPDHPVEDTLGDPAGGEGDIIVTRKSLYVVQIADTQTVDATVNCAPGTGKSYNFVLLLRLDGLTNVVDGGAAHPGSYADPDAQAQGVLDGDSHSSQATPGANHAHGTAQVDLWFSPTRPAEPELRNTLFTDTAGSDAGCHAHA